jgi:hypothetical protein
VLVQLESAREAETVEKPKLGCFPFLFNVGGLTQGLWLNFVGLQLLQRFKVPVSSVVAIF